MEELGIDQVYITGKVMCISHKSVFALFWMHKNVGHSSAGRSHLSPVSQAFSSLSLKASILFCNVTNPIHFAPQCSTGACNGDRKNVFLNTVIGTVNDHDTAELLCASAGLADFRTCISI